MSKKEFNVAVVGATGAVGRTMLSVLEQRQFPIKNLIPLASERSAGKKIRFAGKEVAVQVLTPDAFEGVDIALFSAGGARSLEFAPEAVKRGAVVVDNSSAFRMDPTVPLVVPEVNPEAVAQHKGIIANPNCSTIVMLVALKPLHDAAVLERVVVSTYQSVSGGGEKAMLQLWQENQSLSEAWRNYSAHESIRDAVALQKVDVSKSQVMAQRIGYNLIPHIDVFQSDGYTKEELKMREESRKIMGLPHLKVSATCVRVPVFMAHSESVTCTFSKSISPQQAHALLKKAAGVDLLDNPQENQYPMPLVYGGRDNVGVGRVRQDPDDANVLHLWVVGDNLRKGAALNAVQIAELL